MSPTASLSARPLQPVPLPLGGPPLLQGSAAIHRDLQLEYAPLCGPFMHPDTAHFLPPLLGPHPYWRASHPLPLSSPQAGYPSGQRARRGAAPQVPRGVISSFHSLYHSTSPPPSSGRADLAPFFLQCQMVSLSLQRQVAVALWPRIVTGLHSATCLPPPLLSLQCSPTPLTLLLTLWAAPCALTAAAAHLTADVSLPPLRCSAPKHAVPAA